jgi:hypothetical protein
MFTSDRVRPCNADAANVDAAENRTWVEAMQYSRRRIQRVSGVIVRDERIESRDPSVQPIQEHRGSGSNKGTDSLQHRRKARFPDQIGAAHRERT